MKKILFSIGTLFLSSFMSAQTEVEVVNTPRVGTNNNYVSFRAPLVQAPLMKLPIGKVQPKGWLREFLLRQKDGLNGNLGTVSAWLDKKNNQWLSSTGDHGWEEVPYWLRGYCSLAYILNDDKMKREAYTWFQGVFRNIKEDGFIGPQNFENGRPELWAQMIMLWALQTYYDATGDERVLTAMKNYYQWQMALDDNMLTQGYWEHLRGSDNEWSVLWYYNRTGDDSVLPLIDKLHRCGADWTQKGTLPNWHGVNVAQGFREPATYYMYKGEAALLQAAYDNQFEMRRRYGQMPGGMYAADENARMGYFDPRQGAETCALVEQMASDEIMFEITGDSYWADHCENVAINTFAASMTPDMRALRYLTCPNMAISDEKLHGPSIDNNLRGMLSMSPFSSRCCQHNHGMGWPYYAERLIMATADNGLATMLYAENETEALVADGKTVRIEETTHYPFEGNVTLTIHTDENVEFPLYLRIPAWAEGASVRLLSGALENKGEELVVDHPEGKYIRINRHWSDGDKIELCMPMNLTVDQWAMNKGSVSVNYGPLTLSLKIEEDMEAHDSRDHNFVQDDSHWQEGVDASLWPCYTIKPLSDWNYALSLTERQNMTRSQTVVVEGIEGENGQLTLTNGKVYKKSWPEDNFPFTLESVPLEFSAVGYKIPSWGYDETGMTDLLPTKYADRDETPTEIRLVPMGAARLRISAFPLVIEE